MANSEIIRIFKQLQPFSIMRLNLSLKTCRRGVAFLPMAQSVWWAALLIRGKWLLEPEPSQNVKPRKVDGFAIAVSKFTAVRRATEALTSGLLPEDFSLQTMPDASPPKWHLAHTTWFFEKFLLKRYDPSYREFSRDYDFLFNSYYEQIGTFIKRSHRGFLSRPTIDEVREYRRYVDSAVANFLADSKNLDEEYSLKSILETGVNHEQQHQELLLMDMKYNFFMNPLLPSLDGEFPREPAKDMRDDDRGYFDFGGDTYFIGSDSHGFCFDNERPCHEVILRDFRLRKALVTNGEYLRFVEHGGYQKPQYWLSDGIDFVRSQELESPLYWFKKQGRWWQYTLHGVKELDLRAPLAHISYYEADAFARFSEHRLPSEAEWEVACQNQELRLTGELWQWTQSPYSPYPGFVPTRGDLGEYNGKFMVNQMVLRGGSYGTPKGHIRKTYRNFFYPRCRWQFSGIRLAL